MILQQLQHQDNEYSGDDTITSQKINTMSTNSTLESLLCTVKNLEKEIKFFKSPKANIISDPNINPTSGKPW